MQNGTIEIERELVIDLSRSDDENSITFYAVDFDGDGEFQWAPTPEFRHLFMDNETYEITAYVKDRAGNVREKSLVVTVVNPKETVLPVESDSNGMDLTLVFIMIGVGVLIILAMAGVLAFVLVKRKNESRAPPMKIDPRMKRPPSHPGIRPPAGPPAVPPPPKAPGQISGPAQSPGLPPKH